MFERCFFFLSLLFDHWVYLGHGVSIKISYQQTIVELYLVNKSYVDVFNCFFKHFLIVDFFSWIELSNLGFWRVIVINVFNWAWRVVWVAVFVVLFKFFDFLCLLDFINLRQCNWLHDFHLFELFSFYLLLLVNTNCILDLNLTFFFILSYHLIDIFI